MKKNRIGAVAAIALPATFFAQGCGTYVSPCYVGTTRCDGNSLQTCRGERWVDSLSCYGRCSSSPYECPGGPCCLPP